MSKFEIGSLNSILNEHTIKQMKSNSGKQPSKSQRTVMVKLENILPNPKNSDVYETSGISELAANIETHGLIQPLVVYPSSVSEDSEDSVDMKYILISGHRRRLAMLKLVEDNSPRAADLEFVPCLVMELNENDSDNELELLVDSNISTREKTPAEKAKEISIKKEILLKRKERGETIQGKTIDIIAKEMGISLHQAKKFNAINVNASDEVKDAFNKGEISTQTAYELSKADTDTQNEILKSKEENKDESLTASKVKKEVKRKKKSTSTQIPDDTSFPYGVHAPTPSLSTFGEYEGVDESTSLNIEETQNSTDSTDSTPFPTRLAIVSSLASLMKKLAESDSSISFNEQEIKKARATLNYTYQYVSFRSIEK